MFLSLVVQYCIHIVKL